MATFQMVIRPADLTRQIFGTDTKSAVTKIRQTQHVATGSYTSSSVTNSLQTGKEHRTCHNRLPWWQIGRKMRNWKTVKFVRNLRQHHVFSRRQKLEGRKLEDIRYPVNAEREIWWIAFSSEILNDGNGLRDAPSMWGHLKLHAVGWLLPLANKLSPEPRIVTCWRHTPLWKSLRQELLLPVMISHGQKGECISFNLLNPHALVSSAFGFLEPLG